MKNIPILNKMLNRDNKKYWKILSSNIRAIGLLENNIDKINWKSLSSNPNALHILEKNINNIDWYELCYNPNPYAINIIKENIEYINYLHTKGFHLFDKYVDKIYMSNNTLKEYFAHPYLFELDYSFLKKHMDIIREELMMKVLCPRRLQRYIDMGYTIEDITN